MGCLTSRVDASKCTLVLLRNIQRHLLTSIIFKFNGVAFEGKFCHVATKKQSRKMVILRFKDLNVSISVV